MLDPKKERVKYGEYKARIEIKDSLGTPQYMLTTWRGDIINKIVDTAVKYPFKKGSTVIIEMIPANKYFTNGLFEEE